MTFAAGNCQTTANYLLSLLWIHEVDYPGGLAVTNVKFRVLVWGVSECLLLVVVALNYLPPRAYSWVFKGSMVLMGLDFIICLIWLPIGAARTYGIRTAAEALLTTHNGTGHVAGWNWLLVLIYATGNSIGWDASGHVAEETIDASRVASRGMFWSCLASSCSAFFATILFLFVTPDIATWETFTAPQPFVQVYALAFGKGGATFMTVLAVVGLSACRLRVSFLSFLSLTCASFHSPEHLGRHRRRLTPHFCRRPGWRLARIILDRSGHGRRQAEEVRPFDCYLAPCN